ncbi:hypothetical protein V6x_23510 [Gimesia chilikensis]|uniref:Uncharacterized protein n=1 Tax=Gimesia chilikensis TaxID=2605989 RepID=A0A517WBL6_9PLAN|nr:hypothetical protein [Gimesia chilikensis]QDU02646.1 hypothetical protein V6x_23510 [Gimesia chilikensis]
MDGISSTVVSIIAGLLIFGFISWAVREPGRQLQRKFIKLGDLRGMTRVEIESVVGPPQGISAIDDSSTLLQWMATGYLIALIFEGDVCKGVNQEIAS